MKKSNLNLVFPLVILTLFVCAQVKAQTNVNMAANGVTPGSPFAINPPVTCYFNFFDSGGPVNNYNNGANASATFIPANAATHRIRANFTSFSVEQNWDAFYIFNSNTVGTNQVPGPEGPTFSGFPGGNWQTTSPGIITANTGLAAVGANANEALSFQLRTDNTATRPGWSAIITQVPIAVCTLLPPGPQSVLTGAGSNACFVNVTTAVPSFFPVGCNVGYIVQYRINGGAPTAVAVPGNTVIPAPVGVNVITWELVDPCGLSVLSSGNQLITVTDNTLPVISCPGNITINLTEGACVAPYSYNLNCADNCGVMMPGSVAHPIDFNSSNAGIMFNVINLGFTPMVLTEFGPSLNAGSWTMQVYQTTSASSWVGLENDASAWTLAGNANVISTGPGAGTPVPGFNVSLAPGQSKGIYLTSTTGAPLNYTGIGSPGVLRQFDDGKLRVSSNPGAGKAYPFGATFQSRAYNGYVNYSAASTTQPTLLSGIPSGGSFPKGTTTNIFQCIDAAGNVANCAFNVTVVPFAGATSSLTCNDLVTVALGTNCTSVVGADDVLEGGPYGCYDDYTVELDKTPPFGNGPWVPAILSSADIGKTYKVRVTDPNGNRCSGDLKVLDNLPPQMNCNLNAQTVPCSFSIDPGFSDVTTATLRFSAQGLPQNVVDFQTRTYSLPVNLPANATINDVDLRVKISGDGFFGNLRIEVESPLGTIVKTWDQVSGCAPAPVWIRFDDEGSPAITCPAFSTDQRGQIPFGAGILAIFDGQLASGTWKIRISDLDGGGDVSNIEIAELFLNVTANFGTGLPNGLSIPPVTPNGLNSFNVPAGLLDACSAVTLTYTDMVAPQNCQSDYTSIITRRWMAKDASGNTSVCFQTIYLIRPNINDVEFPPDYDGIDAPEFSCTGDYPTPELINGMGLQGSPFVFGQSTGCSINWDYIDAIVWICSGSYNIQRTWTVNDDCNNNLLQHVQTLRIRDKTGPTFVECPADVSTTTDPFSCCSTVNLPDVLVTDVCSKISNINAVITTVDPLTQTILDEFVVLGNVISFPGNDLSNPDTLGAFGNSPCLPAGTHYVTYTVQDNCGNTSTCSFSLSVNDYSPPVADCDEFTVVAIGIDDPQDCYYPSANGCEFAGVTWAKAASFDDGSYDNCNGIRFRIRRAAPYSACIQDLNDCEFATATAEADSIKFYCCEVGTTFSVILRVYQLDPDGNISLYPDGSPIYNECQVQVSVQDKLKPACDPPLNITVNCENFDPSLWAYGKPVVYDNCCLDSTKMYQGQKGLTHSVNYNLFDTVCNRGTIIRTFRTYDCHGLSGQCTQRIVVNYEQDYFIKFPDDKIVTVCDGMGTFGEPQFFGEDCELLGVSYQDQIFTVVPDACFKIERTWKIINWCTYNPNLPCIEVPNPNPNATTNHPSNLPGPTVSPVGTLAPWAPTVVKINPGDPGATNYGAFWNADANCYQYKQIIKVIDTQAPIAICQTSPVEICDMTQNNPQLWNESYWWNADCATHDLCEAPADIKVAGTDLCSGQNITIRYLLYLDLDFDGIMETVVSSASQPEPNVVRFNNANTPNFSGGTPRGFDERPVPITQKYRFTLQTAVVGTSVSAAIRWNTQQDPNTYVTPELPYGTHKVKWILSDGCGNETVCEYTIIIKDCKGPTVVCINGLSANVMPNGLTLFVSDFLLDAYDNCTPLDFLQFGIRKSGTGTGFPYDGNGSPQSTVFFNCDELGTQPVEIWAIDKAGNADYCETYIIIQDNLHNCPDAIGSASVAGLLKTESADGLEESDVELSGQNPTGPTFNYFGMTDYTGAYKFTDAVPMFSNYTVTPTKDDNPLNGVTTYDLVMISKHILGIEPMTTPYRMIAADANGSGSITTTDIVELRKLILGIYDELPNNTSWRFVDKEYVFPNPVNPFQAQFPENKSVADIHDSQMEDNFMAIKIGDVNGTAIANSLMSADDRASGTLVFDVEDRAVKAGEIVTVTFTAAEKASGYQFTLQYPDLDLIDVMPAGDLTAENFALFADKHAITTSWFGQQAGAMEFSVKFKTKKAGELHDMLGISSSITKAEAYSQVSDDRLDVAFRFKSASGMTISGVGFELYQNQPNPFMNKTVVGFHLPEASDATLTVFDDNGRRLYTQKGVFAKGYNYFNLERSMLNSTGVLYYTLETTVGSATKKMIGVK